MKSETTFKTQCPLSFFLSTLIKDKINPFPSDQSVIKERLDQLNQSIYEIEHYKTNLINTIQPEELEKLKSENVALREIVDKDLQPYLPEQIFTTPYENLLEDLKEDKLYPKQNLFQVQEDDEKILLSDDVIYSISIELGQGSFGEVYFGESK